MGEALNKVEDLVANLEKSLVEAKAKATELRKWDTPANLREREHAQQIECQDAFSGRWRPAFDHYWDDCVIEVKWRWIERAEATRSERDVP